MAAVSTPCAISALWFTTAGIESTGKGVTAVTQPMPSGDAAQPALEMALDDGLVVFEDGRLLVLNATAAMIWDAHRSGISASEIALRLSGRFDIPLDQARGDVAAAETSWTQPESERVPGDQFVTDRHRRAGSLPSIDWFKNHYRVCETSVSLCCDHDQTAQRLHQPLSHLRSPATGNSDCAIHVFREETEHVAVVDGFELVRSPIFDYVAMHVMAEIARRAAMESDWLVILHAAALSNGHGCVVLPGHGGCGKSTLATALLYSGFNYLGDDLVPLARGTRQAIPVPMAPKIENDSVKILSRFDPDISHLPAFRIGEYPPTRYLTSRTLAEGVQMGTLPVEYMVFPHWSSTESTCLVPISNFQALEDLLQSGALLRTPLDKSTITDLVAWVSEVPAYQLRYDDPSEAVEYIRRLFGRREPESPG